MNEIGTLYNQHAFDSPAVDDRASISSTDGSKGDPREKTSTRGRPGRIAIGNQCRRPTSAGKRLVKVCLAQQVDAMIADISNV